MNPVARERTANVSMAFAMAGVGHALRARSSSSVSGVAGRRSVGVAREVLLRCDV